MTASINPYPPNIAGDNLGDWFGANPVSWRLPWWCALLNVIEDRADDSGSVTSAMTRNYPPQSVIVDADREAIGRRPASIAAPR